MCNINNGNILNCFTTASLEESFYIGNWSTDMVPSYNAKNMMTGVTSGQTVYLFTGHINWQDLQQTANVVQENGVISYDGNFNFKMISVGEDHLDLMRKITSSPLFIFTKSKAGSPIAIGINTPARATNVVTTINGEMNETSFTLSSSDKLGIIAYDETLLGTSFPIG